MRVLRADTPLAASRSLGVEAPPLGVAVFMLGADTTQGTTLAVALMVECQSSSNSASSGYKSEMGQTQIEFKADGFPFRYD